MRHLEAHLQARDLAGKQSGLLASLRAKHHTLKSASLHFDSKGEKITNGEKILKEGKSGGFTIVGFRL